MLPFFILQECASLSKGKLGKTITLSIPYFHSLWYAIWHIIGTYQINAWGSNNYWNAPLVTVCHLEKPDDYKPGGPSDTEWTMQNHMRFNPKMEGKQQCGGTQGWGMGVFRRRKFPDQEEICWEGQVSLCHRAEILHSANQRERKWSLTHSTPSFLKIYLFVWEAVWGWSHGIVN